jgi:peptide/nickel transport system substrate-binding protein
VCLSWSTSQDGKTLTFRLRPGIEFQGGQSLEATDVKYSLDKIMGFVDGVQSRSAGALASLVDRSQGTSQYTRDGQKDGVTVVNPATVQIHLAARSRLAPQLLTTGGAAIVPRGSTNATLARTTNGTGPYILVRQDTSQVQLARNPKYFRSSTPYIDNVNIFPVLDETAAITAVLSGRLDFFVTRNVLPASLAGQVASQVKAGRLRSVRLTQYRTPDGITLNLRKAPFDNPLVRRAFNLAIDRTALNNVIYNGQAEPALPMSNTAVGRPGKDVWNVLPGWGTGSKKRAEIAEARRLLAQAGYANGIDVELLTINTTATQQLAEFFASALAPIGVKATIQAVDSGVFIQRLAASNYQAGVIFFSVISTSPLEPLLKHYVTKAAQNYEGYSSSVVDSLTERVAVSTNRAEIKRMYRQIENRILTDLPYVPSLSPNVMALVASKLRGVEPAFGQFSSSMTRLDSAWISR